ncbi:DUF6471 domain-containing protein [Sphingorhabdus sp.]|uniref:DUF6471 domain-containing protein n=1 Tax=Sphingorhabdus sp. TaxID=1902408 RepID=UPI0037CC8C8B
MEHKRRNASYGRRVKKLSEIMGIDSQPNVRHKLRRGNFKAVFLLRCLQAFGASSSRVQE